jgi:hypothetical protein
METSGTVKTILKDFLHPFCQAGQSVLRCSGIRYSTPMSEKGKTPDFPGFDASQHRSMLANVDASKIVDAEKPVLDPSLAVPPPMPPEGATGVSDEGHEVFDRISSVVDKVKRSREAVKSFYQSLSNIAGAFEYKEDRTDQETRFLHEVLS